MLIPPTWTKCCTQSLPSVTVDGIYPVPHNPGFPVLLPFLPPKERLIGDAAGVIFDCTWPKDWPPDTIPVKATFENLWPKELQERVLWNWQSYGFRRE